MNTDIQLVLPFTIDDWGGIDEVYVDCAPSFGFISCFYTPEGIKQLDSDFGRRIRALAGKKKSRRLWEYKLLKREIMQNEHLHPCIKQNLLVNLENYAELEPLCHGVRRSL